MRNARILLAAVIVGAAVIADTFNRVALAGTLLAAAEDSAGVRLLDVAGSKAVKGVEGR